MTPVKVPCRRRTHLLVTGCVQRLETGDDAKLGKTISCGPYRDVRACVRCWSVRACVRCWSVRACVRACVRSLPSVRSGLSREHLSNFLFVDMGGNKTLVSSSDEDDDFVQLPSKRRLRRLSFSHVTRFVSGERSRLANGIKKEAPVEECRKRVAPTNADEDKKESQKRKLNATTKSPPNRLQTAQKPPASVCTREPNWFQKSTTRRLLCLQRRSPS